jgi:hypothetical protein
VNASNRSGGARLPVFELSGDDHEPAATKGYVPTVVFPSSIVGTSRVRRVPFVEIVLSLALVTALILAGASARPSPEALSFRDFFESGLGPLRLSERMRRLDGKRVRMVGFMAEMESPPTGGFYLCQAPVAAGEGGGGTADLPPSAVLVVVRSAGGKVLGHRRQPLEVTGVLQLGAQVDREGRVSRIRILLDGPMPETQAAP